MTRIIIMTAAILLLSACSASDHDVENFDGAALDQEAMRLMKLEKVQGMAIAVIEEGQIVYVAAYGKRNVEKNLPLTTDTVMYGASLTKTAFATLVLQLADEGRIDLDASVADLLPRPLPEYKGEDEDWTDLKNDPRWKSLTPRIMLTQGTGFANFRWLEEDGKLKFHTDPGTRYGYSAEGFYILQFILEEGLGLDVGKEMQTRIFDRFGMKNTSMTWRADFSKNLADGYAMDGSYQVHDDRSSVSAAGSMDTSIADQAKMWAAIVRGDGLSKASRTALTRPSLFITSAHQFPTFMTDEGADNKALNLSAGLGLVTFKDTSGAAFFKGGHNPWTGNMVICLEHKKRCVVMMANDVRAELIYPALAKYILGETKMPWNWEYHYE